MNSNTENVSIAKMNSPEGWIESGQTPEFDEYTVVLSGTLCVKTKRETFSKEDGNMSKLVDELKKEHAVIVETLNKVKSLGISSKESQNILIAAESGLLAHLQKEDEQLYPVLNRAAESDADLKQTLDMFAKDIENRFGIL